MEPYSALEVVPKQQPNHSTEKIFVRPYSQDPEVVPGKQSQYPELVPGEQLGYPEVGNRDTWSGANAPEPFNPEYGQGGPLHGLSPATAAAASGDEEGVEQQSKICGLGRRAFLILLGFIIVVIIGVVVGTTVGILTTKKHSGDDGLASNSTGTTSDGSNTLSNSSFSAVNFTDPSGYNHRILFFQDPYNNIIERRWDSQNNTWATTNISQVMSNSATPINVPLGTALAATALGRQVELFLIDRSSLIRSLYCSDMISSPDLWQNYTLNNTLYTYPGSRLAATVKGCGTDDSVCSCNLDFCTAGWIVAFQRQEDGAVITTNYSSAWSARELAVNDNEVMASTSLALITQYQGDEGAMGLVSQRYLSGTEGDVRVTKYTDDHVWGSTNATSIITNVPAPATLEHVVVSKWRDWSTTLSYVLLGNGTLRGTWWDDSTSTALGSITLEGAPENVNFTSISMTHDAVLYGISNDKILEFTVDDSDPSKLHYVAIVYP
ncbi:hypothetical protein SCAR479_00966 [Seiridium cardinale]|uniref:Fucose-specific lectin n=1 Tax=Seiridium cardinale TaxID=138064 RepID=A0ABR2Y7C2_9PEZI